MISKISLRNQTKSRFDALLKSALERKSSKSQQNLVPNDSDEEESSAHSQEVIEVDVYNDMNVENKSYLMEKFLNDPVEKRLPPVPKPRKNISNSSHSGTNLQEMECISITDNNSGTSENKSCENPPQPAPRTRRKLTKAMKEIHTSITTKSDKTEERANGELQPELLTDSKQGRNSKERKSDDQSESIEMEDFHNQQEPVIEENDAGIFPEITYENESKLSNSSHETIELEKSKREGDKNVYNYSSIVEILVHGTDRLLIDSCVVHPVVKIHIVDAASGKYLKKSDRGRNVLFYDESLSVDYIGSIMTQAYNLQENRSYNAKWEETILINDDAKYILDKQSIIILFEIIDFLNVSTIHQSTDRDTLGWYRIAWAFLHPKTHLSCHVDKKLCLQLFHPQKAKKNENCPIYNWWKDKKFRKYPSTLYVTIKKVASPEKVVETMRSKTPHEIERGRCKLLENKEKKEVNVEVSANWSKVGNQISKLPNEVMEKVDSYDEGCVAMKFSGDGKFLAYGAIIDATHMIVIYSIVTKTEVTKLIGHQGLIYGLCWGREDKILVTTSADCTACIWDMTNYKFIEMLPHPSFVYSCATSDTYIATGCYDQYVRLWMFESEGKYKLYDELKAHDGFITSICFNKTGSMLYSSDSVGVIVVWKIITEEWQQKGIIQILDLKNVPINQILLHKRERRLLVNSRDSKNRLVDIKTGYILQTYEQALNNKMQISGCFTPCNNFILSGSESGDLYAWNTETGEIEQIFRPYGAKVPINCVQFHPSDNCMVVCNYGSALPILLYGYNKESDKSDGINKCVENLIGPVYQKTRRKTEYDINFRHILEKMDLIISPRQ